MASKFFDSTLFLLIFFLTICFVQFYFEYDLLKRTLKQHGALLESWCHDPYYPIEQSGEIYEKTLSTMVKTVNKFNIKMPRLIIFGSPSRIEAFAVGYNEDFSIAISRGIIEKMNEEELSAVIAHEASNIQNRDVEKSEKLTSLFRSIAITSILFSVISIESVFLKEANPYLLVIFPTIFAFSYFFKAWYRRRQEYQDDLFTAKK